jgi:hypothetical protein
MLEHGDAAGRSFLDQLPGVRVISQCACGCGSIDFEVDGLGRPEGGLRILGDFVIGESLYGAFIFERGRVLAGIELYAMAVDPPGTLPDPELLRDWSELSSA